MYIAFPVQYNLVPSNSYKTYEFGSWRLGVFALGIKKLTEKCFITKMQFSFHGFTLWKTIKIKIVFLIKTCSSKTIYIYITWTNTKIKFNSSNFKVEGF